MLFCDVAATHRAENMFGQSSARYTFEDAGDALDLAGRRGDHPHAVVLAAARDVRAARAPRHAQDLGEHGERVSDHRKVLETLSKARKYTQYTIKYIGEAKDGTAGGVPDLHTCAY